LESNISDFLVRKRITLRDAIKKLDESHRKILFVIEEDGKLYGALSDGDIRRWILGSKGLNDQVAEVCNHDPIWIKPDYDLADVKRLMLESRIQAVPVLDEDHQIVDLLFWDDVFDNENRIEIHDQLDIPVVIMAGGAGTRLDPFTRILPKALIPIGDRSIMEVIIDKFRDYGVSRFYISLFNKAKLIKAYMEEVNPPYEFSYLEESKPLGTVGVLSRLKTVVEDSIILANCDTIITCNYKDLVDFHSKNKYDITLVGSMINYSVPYGICEIAKEGKLVKLTEKPEYSYLVSTGMYIIRKSALEQIPHDEFFNMTDLISSVRASGRTVGVYPISEKSWMDTGEWHEYKKTVEQLSI
jgi:dTDP-glucose pyrophosphorylase